MSELKRWLLKLALGKEVYQTMAVIYATLIIKGKKKLSQVPAVIREEVKTILRIWRSPLRSNPRDALYK